MSKITIIPHDKLAAAIAANTKAHAKVDGQWQVLAVSAIHAFAEHGNVFYINAVYKAMGKGARHAAMTAFFLAFGGIKANKGENKDETPFVKDADKQADLEGAESTMWFDMAPSAKPDETIDYLALVLKAIKRSPKEGQSVKNTKFREAVQKLATAMQTEGEDAALAGVSGT